MRIHSYENVFCLLVSFYANQTHYHMKGFSLCLVLRHEVTKMILRGVEGGRGVIERRRALKKERELIIELLRYLLLELCHLN